MKIEHSIEIAAPVARVWEFTIDVESWPLHSPTMTSVVLVETGPLAVGSQARIKQPQQPERVWTITKLEPERHFAWATKAMGTTMTASHVLTPNDGGTTNTLSVEIEGPLSALVGVFVRGPILKAITAENEGFKAAAER